MKNVFKAIKNFIALEDQTEVVEKATTTTPQFTVQRVLKRGSDHPDFCQDAVAIGGTSNYLYFCVFDGCSGGIDSHFASTLFNKIFNDILNNYQAQIDVREKGLEHNIKYIVFSVARKLREVKHVLNLHGKELLSTMIICGVDKQTKEAIICAFGDGFYSVNGQHHIIKNTRFLEADKYNGENSPDYMAYDLDSIQNFSSFEAWFSQKSEVHHFTDVKDVTISTDGINTFRQFKSTFVDKKGVTQPVPEIDPVDFLVVDSEWMGTANMLARKCNIINNKHCMTNQDDLGIVRVQFKT